MSFGIALSGGGTRGAAHVGVLCALAEAGLVPDSISGTSAGSIVAGLYASGFGPDALKAIVNELTKSGSRLIDADYVGILKSSHQFFCHKQITFSGLIKGNKLEAYLLWLTKGKNINAVNLRTVIPAVDLYSGKTIAYTNSLNDVKQLENVVWETDQKLATAMRASSAVPAVFQPKILGDKCLVDGGVTDMLPVNLLLATGETNVLAVDLERDYHGPACDNIIEISSHSLSIMSQRLSDCAAVGEKLSIKPTLPKTAGLLTFKDMKKCMEAGYEATVALLPVIKVLFGETNKGVDYV